MKPSELRPLIGRNVSCFLDGERIARVVAAPASDTLSVDPSKSVEGIQVRLSPRRIPVEQVRGVLWRGRLVPVAVWLQMRAQASAGGRP